MPPTLPAPGTPYYGGGQVVNPANVIVITGAPTNKFTEDGLGTIRVDNTAAKAYMLVSKSGGVDTWDQIAGSGSGTVTSVTGTANQITASPTTGAVVLSLPVAITTPGSLTTTTTLAAGTALSSGTTITAGTSITATLGNITATNGNLVLSAAGNKLVIHATTAASDSVGVTAAMSGTPGAVTVTSSAVTTSSVILYSRATTGGTPGQVSITAQSAGSFTLTSTGNETSTFNYLIIN